jgi:hypothetical protein
MTNRLISLALAGALSLGLMTAAPASQGSGCMPTTGTVSGLTFAQSVNAALAALTSLFSGASAPATDCSAAAVKGQPWVDTSVTPNVVRQYDGTAWVALGALDGTNHLWMPPVGGGSASITAGTTTDICAAPAAVQYISGVTPITGFGTNCVVGQRKTLIFNSATPITHNATSLIVPGLTNYTASVGDMADLIYLGSGNWRIKEISRIDGSSVVNPSVPVGTIIYGIWGTIPPKTVYGAAYALPRATYPAYLAAVTRSQSGTLTSGNNTITSVASTAGLGQGMPLEGVGIQAGTTIASVTGTTIVMSAVATANGSQTVTTFLTGYGTGGDSTTVGVFDCRGRAMAGRPDMGGGDTGRLAAGYFGTSALKLGAAGGLDHSPIDQTNLPAVTYNLTGTLGTATSNGASWVQNPNGVAIGMTANQQPPAPAIGYGFSAASFQGAITSTFTPAGTIGPLGSGVALPNVQPTAIAECVVVVQP